jgi:hypothetical protein
MIKNTLVTFKYNIKNPLNRIIREIEIIEKDLSVADDRIKLFRDLKTTNHCTIDRVAKKYYHIKSISTLQNKSIYSNYSCPNIEKSGLI